MNFELIECKNKKELVDKIAEYIKDSVVYIAVLKVNKKWNYILLDFLQEEDEDFLKELDKLDDCSVLLNGYDNCLTSKLAISRSITYFRNQYALEV